MELHSPLSNNTLVYCNNVSVVYLASNIVQHQHTKYVEIDLHFVRDKVTIIGEVHVLHVLMASQFTDIFTKGLLSPFFSVFCSSLNICRDYSWDCMRGDRIYLCCIIGTWVRNHLLCEA
jgi:hypothetical protein